MTDPRFVREYAEQLAKLGSPRFSEQFGSDVLVGIGIVGELADDKDGRRRTHKSVGREEYVPVQSLLDRVWRLVPCDKPVSEKYITLGYSAECDVMIPEYTLSSRHCAFSRRPPVRLADLGSLNGTVVNDNEIPRRKPVELKDADELVLGRMKLRYHTAEGFIAVLWAFLGEEAEV